MESIVAAVTAVFTAIGKALGLVQSQADANTAAAQKQAGVDAEKSASLEKSAEIARSQTAAVIAAPTDEAGTIDAMRKGGF